MVSASMTSGKEEAGKRVSPKYAAWLVDSASPSLRKSLPASPGVEQWAGELSSMKFLLLEVLMIRGGRSTLMTVCSSSCTSGCSSHGLSEAHFGKGRGKRNNHKADLPWYTPSNATSSSSKPEHTEMWAFPTKYGFFHGQHSVIGTLGSPVAGIQGLVFSARSPAYQFILFSFGKYLGCTDLTFEIRFS